MKELILIIAALCLFAAAIALSFHVGYRQRIQGIGDGTFAAKTFQVTNCVYTTKTVLERK